MQANARSPIHDAILQAWECAFGNSPIVYLSGPISTGLRNVERLRLKGGTQTKSAMIEANTKEVRAVATRLRRELGQTVVEPASLKIAEWSQPDYLLLWQSLIGRYVKLVMFMPGWEYSVGCATEYTWALKHGVRTESVTGSAIAIDDALMLLNAACENILSNGGSDNIELVILAKKLTAIIDQLESERRPRSGVVSEILRKDASLDLLATTMNVAQFVSFTPSNSKPNQAFSRIAGEGANRRFSDALTAIEALLRASSESSINVRSYEPSSPQSREFIYGLRSAYDALSAVERLSREGLHTIVNETIDVKDGGVSGVLMGDVLEFAPDDTPRCVEKPGTASLPRGWGRQLLSSVYGFPIDLDVPLASRLEFSIHPRPRGWKQSNILAWEFSEQDYVSAKAQPRWPNKFSKLVGDKVFGLLVAHHVGLPVPFTTVINRRVAPFSFGVPTHSGETWIRTAPFEQVPGKFTTHHGWLDPFKLMAAEDSVGDTLTSILSQQGVKQIYSGALIMGRHGQLIVEGKRGGGESLMLGTSIPELLPDNIEAEVRALYARAEASLGVVRFEWVHDGDHAWIVQLHAGATDTTLEYITSKSAKRWQTFDVREGLEALREALHTLPEGTGIMLSGRVGLTSHFADVLRRANVPARMN